MAVDFATGTVVFDDGATLLPRMPREAVPPAGRRVLEGTAFGCSYAFEAGELTQVRLVHADLTSPDPEAARRLHDAWLAERLGPGEPWNAGAHPYGGVEHRFPWGTAGSYAVPQDLSAYVGFTYR